MTLFKFIFYAFISLLVLVVIASFFDHDDKSNSPKAQATNDSSSNSPSPRTEVDPNEKRSVDHSDDESALYRASKALRGSDVGGAPAVEPLMATTAQEIFQRYSANEVAADHYFGGHVLQISAQVASVNKDFLGGINLSLSAGGEFQTMEASLSGGQESVAGSLSPGQTITLQCRSVEKIMVSPYARKCVIQ